MLHASIQAGPKVAPVKPLFPIPICDKTHNFGPRYTWSWKFRFSQDLSHIRNSISLSLGRSACACLFYSAAQKKSYWEIGEWGLVARHAPPPSRRGGGMNLKNFGSCFYVRKIWPLKLGWKMSSNSIETIIKSQHTNKGSTKRGSGIQDSKPPVYLAKCKRHTQGLSLWTFKVTVEF